MKRTRLRQKSKAPSAIIKDDIQALVRQIVIIRDGGCILREYQHQSCACGGYAKDGHLILQADHLVTRGNNPTYGDTRLIVCLCKAHHGWKSVGGNLRKGRYDALVKTILPKDRLLLWAIAEADSHKTYPMHAADWMLVKLALESELRSYSQDQDPTAPNYVIV